MKVWGVMGSPRITYTPHPDATPEAEKDALAAVYRLLLDKTRASGADERGTEKGGSSCDEDLGKLSCDNETSPPLAGEVPDPGADRRVSPGERSG